MPDAGPNRFTNIGSVTAAVRAGSTRIFSLSADNANAADRYLQLHNLAAVPTGAEVPVQSFRCPANSTIIVGTDYFTNNGTNFPLGLMFAFSTTRDTYTAATGSDHCFRAAYA